MWQENSPHTITPAAAAEGLIQGRMDHSVLLFTPNSDPNV